MQSKILSRQAILIVLFLIILVLLSVFLFRRSSRQNNSLADGQAKAVALSNSASFASPSAGHPVRLIISKIKINAAVDPVGVTSTGAMEVPSAPENVGWFKFGPIPGDNGSAVIDGHYGLWKNGDIAVFDHLDQLKPGDDIVIEDEKGAITTFVVRESRVYSPTEDASNVFNSSDGRAHLNLITCGGTWDEALKSYPDRLVVFADKV
jgi:LPXTG-site transpeptidase (sortase) family protein